MCVPNIRDRSRKPRVSDWKPNIVMVVLVLDDSPLATVSGNPEELALDRPLQKLHRRVLLQVDGGGLEGGWMSQALCNAWDADVGR